MQTLFINIKDGAVIVVNKVAGLAIDIVQAIGSALT